MKRIKYVLMFIFLFSVLNVKAIDGCQNDEMTHLRELAGLVEFKTSYEITKDLDDVNRAVYSIQVINMNDDLKILYRDDSSSEFELVSKEELESYKFLDGTTLEFRIYSYTANMCTNELLKTEKVELVKYNHYYDENKEKCERYPDFKYCKEFMNVSYDEFEEIDKLFDKYVKEDGGIVLDIESNNTYIYIIGGVLLGIAVITGIIVYRRNKKKKLEI